MVGTLCKWWLCQSEYEHAIYCKGTNDNQHIVEVYINDLIITSTTLSETKKFKEDMKIQFKMCDIGLLIFYLGLEVQNVETTKWEIVSTQSLPEWWWPKMGVYALLNKH
jgi:hypothetical protein